MNGRAGELESAQARVTELEQQAREVATVAATELATVRAELTSATTHAERAKARVEEIEHRAGELRAELDRVHADIERLQTELAAVRHALRPADRGCRYSFSRTVTVQQFLVS
ncbi:hypothetical protein [Paraburkholderia humisilvae]|uniref:hypothetical protein n=1 Tax=Paraburkholderia humisilvae TaxID=627669 RepID=UPI00158429F4|nr:hypothetical protein [Paraburkholderia humisilvae]